MTPLSTNYPAVIKSKPVAVDAMGGDHGPRVVVEGAVAAARELKISSILVGDETEIKLALKEFGATDERLLQVRHASEVVTMEDSPSLAIRGKTDSSVRVAFELVKSGEAAGVISPGNTGAVVAAGLYVSGTISGIARPAIASLIPKLGDGQPTILVDSGANIDCHAYQLVQFALMGNYYAISAFTSCTRPRVALLSNGTESSKGTDIIRSAAHTLSEIDGLNFIGYIEGRDIPRDVADVVVCDGFLGNIVLKTMEGTAELVLDSIRQYVERSAKAKLGIWLAKPMFKALFRDKLDPSAYGGAPLLGLNDVAIVAHGSSNSRAIMNGIRVARKFADEALVEKIEAALDSLDSKMPGAYEDGLWNRMGQKFEKGRNGKKSRGKKGEVVEGNKDNTGKDSKISEDVK